MAVNVEPALFIRTALEGGESGEGRKGGEGGEGWEGWECKGGGGVSGVMSGREEGPKVCRVFYLKHFIFLNWRKGAFDLHDNENSSSITSHLYSFSFDFSCFIYI